MPGRSMVNQVAYLQKEVTPGTAVTAAMKRILGLRLTPGWSVEGEDFKASGSKVNTSRITNTETGAPSVEAVMDYNTLTWLLTGAFGAPTSTLVATTTGAYEHVYTLNAEGADPFVSFTAMWGDPTLALQLRQFVFNSLSLTIGRTSNTVDAGAMSEAPDTGIALPATGVTDVASVPIAGRSWDVYVDDTEAALGTTKLTALYEANPSFGDKYTPDYVVNSNLPSFESLLEAEDSAYTLAMTVGLNATAVGLISSFRAGSVKFARLQSTGPVIEGATNYSLELDIAFRITDPGEVGTAPNSPSVVIPFNAQMTVDPVSGFVAGARLVNTVASL